MRFYSGNLFLEPSPNQGLPRGRAQQNNAGQPAQPTQTAITDENGKVLLDENGNAIVIQ